MARSPEDVERGLTVLADQGGNTRRAAEITGIAKSTLHQWMTDTYAERYAVIRADRLPKLYERVGDELVGLLREQNEAERKLTARTREVTPELDARDVAGALRNVAVAKGINADKARVMHDRPTEIHEHRSASEILAAMRRKGFILDGEAEEIKPPELPEETGRTN